MFRLKKERGLGFGFLQNHGISLAKGKPVKIIPQKSKQQQCLKRIRACFEIVFPVAIGSKKSKWIFQKIFFTSALGRYEN